MKKENILSVQRVIATLTISAVFALSVAAQSEPVCSKYYAVGSRTCAAAADGGGGLGSGNVVGNGQLGSGGFVDNGQLGSGNVVGNGQLGTGSVTGDGGDGRQLGSGGFVDGGFWSWVMSIF